MAKKSDIKAADKERTGHPLSKIDWELVDEYLKAQCDGAEIAPILGVCPDTLYRACEREKKMTFAAYKAQKAAAGQGVLRKIQYDTAKDGNIPMQIWLGKQILDQKDKKEIEQRNQTTIEVTPATDKQAELIEKLKNRPDAT